VKYKKMMVRRIRDLMSKPVSQLTETERKELFQLLEMTNEDEAEKAL